MSRFVRFTTFAGCAALALLVFEPSSAAEIAKLREVSFAGASQWKVFGSGDQVKVEKGRLTFHTPDGKQRRSLNLRGKEHLVGPAGADVVGVLLYADRQPMTLSVVAFELYNNLGQRKYRIDKPKFAKTVVSPSGNALCGIDGAEGLPESTLRFYDAGGDLINVMAVKELEGGRFSRDGSRFLFRTAAEGLQVASADGELIESIGPVSAWGASADGRMVVTVIGPRLVFYYDGGLTGTLRWPESHGTISAVAVSPDGRHAAVLSTAHAAAVRIEPPLYLWDLRAEDPAWKYRSIDLIDGAHLAVIGADYDPGPESASRHTKSRCLFIEIDGEVAHKRERDAAAWAPGYPQVWFSADGRRTAMVDRDAVTWFSIEGL